MGRGLSQEGVRNVAAGVTQMTGAAAGRNASRGRIGQGTPVASHNSRPPPYGTVDQQRDQRFKPQAPKIATTNNRLARF